MSGVISINYWNVSCRLWKGLEYTILVLVDGYNNNNLFLLPKRQREHARAIWYHLYHL